VRARACSRPPVPITSALTGPKASRPEGVLRPPAVPLPQLDGLLAARSHPDAPERGAGEVLEGAHVGLGVLRELLERPAAGDVPFYAENYGNALARRVTKEIGKRFAEQNIVDDPQDVYFLLPEEISVRILGRFPAQQLVAKRKEEHARFRRAEPDLFIGDITKLGEVIASSPMLRSTQQPHPRVRPELNADLYGTVSTPGVAEGVVKVLRTEEDFDKFEPGDILVTIETSSVWTPLFNVAKAVVTDVGGILSHSAILGREYGLPVISGCVEGTKKLKTGMRVRVDGDVGAVYILEDSRQDPPE